MSWRTKTNRENQRGTTRQIVRVTDEGVQQVIADLQRINSGLDQTDVKAKRTAANVDAAQGKGGALEGFLGRARASGFLTGSGLHLGPVQIGRNGAGLDMGWISGRSAGASVAGPLIAAEIVARSANALGTAMTDLARVRDWTKATDLNRAMDRARLSASERVLDHFGVFALAGGIDTLIMGNSVAGSEAGMAEWLEKTFHPKERRERESLERWRKAFVAEKIADAEANVQAKLRELQAGIDKETSRAVTRMYRTRQLGIKFARGVDQERAERQIDDLNERLKYQEAEQKKREAAKLAKNQGA